MGRADCRIASSLATRERPPAPAGDGRCTCRKSKICKEGKAWFNSNDSKAGFRTTGKGCCVTTDADRQDPKGKIADGNQQHLGGAKPDADRHEPLDAKPDADKEYPNREIAEADRQELLDAKPDADRQELLGAKPDADPQELLGEKPDADKEYPNREITDGNEPPVGGEIAEADRQEPLGEKPDADQPEPAGVQLDAEQRDFLAKLDAKWRDPIGAKPDADRQEPLGKEPDADRQEPTREITDGNEFPVGGEIADANRQEPLGKEPDADKEDPNREITDTDRQEPLGAKPDAGQQYSFGAIEAGNEPHVGGEIADADRQEPLGEKPDAGQQYSFCAIEAGNEQHVGGEIADANRQEPLGEKPDAGRQYSFGARPDEEKQDPAVEPLPAIEPLPAVEPPPTVEPPKRKANLLFLIIAIGAGVGILLGIAIAAITWNEAKPTPPPGPIVAQEPSLPHETKDLGTVTSNTVGLQGHLITKWDDKLEYSLVIEPNDPAHLAGFALAVSDPPRPLSIVVELKNFAGFVLCRQNIVLKYDAGKAAALAAARAKNLAGKSHGSNISSDQDNQAAGLDQLEAQEAERERGKDIFRNQTGPNGQIESIRSQGEIPCPAIAYGSVAYWSFTPNFPAVDEQDELLKRRANATSPSSKTPAARKGAK